MQTKTDNISAKAWIQKHKCRSLLLQSACMAQTYMQMNSKVDIASVVHHPGKEMMDIDLESRREEFLGVNEFARSLPPEFEVDIDSFPIIRRFVELTNPAKCEKCLQDMHVAYLAVAQEFGAFINRTDPPVVKFKEPPAKYTLVDFDHENKKRVSVQTLFYI